MIKNSLFAVGTLCFAVSLYGQATFTAKIVLEGGAPIHGTAQVIPQLNSRLVPDCSLATYNDGMIEYRILNTELESQLHPLSRGHTGDECDVAIILKGYRPVHVTLKDKAVIVLKRDGDPEGSSISMTALNAPKDAKKAFDQGQAALSQRKWDVAQKDLEKAVAIYPEYAPAWNDLGEALVSQSKLPEARAAWEHAVKADPKYIRPYLQLVRMAIVENRNQDASDLAERALAQNPVEFPAIYFYYAVAQHVLGHQDVAEKFATRAIELDTQHEYPRAEYMLASLLVAKGDRAGAIQHLNKYLAYAPKASDADAVRKQIADLETAN